MSRLYGYETVVVRIAKAWDSPHPSPSLRNRWGQSRFCWAGHLNYTVAWILLTFLGLFGIHRMYLGKWISGLIYLLTGGIFGLGYLYISVLNRR
ncbi:MAG: NINE protein [Desulfuromonadaceae bacterium]|nr:NINE protein [Desulfuromonadaceae bacterium]